jgi:hypothetical protein
MTNKRKIEILKQSIVSLKQRQTWGRYIGICETFNYLYSSEWGIMSSYFKSQRPGLFSKFFWNINYQPLNPFWWSQDEGGFKQRVKFLEYLIKKLEK